MSSNPAPLETSGALTRPVVAIAALLAVIFDARSSRAAQRTLAAQTRPVREAITPGADPWYVEHRWTREVRRGWG